MLTKSEPLTYREAEGHIHTPTQEILYNAAAKGLFFAEEDSMGLKIQNSSLPPMKVLISKKLHILRPAIEYVQHISKPKKVRLSGDVDAVCVVFSWFTDPFIYLFIVKSLRQTGENSQETE